MKNYQINKLLLSSLFFVGGCSIFEAPANNFQSNTYLAFAPTDNNHQISKGDSLPFITPHTQNKIKSKFDLLLQSPYLRQSDTVYKDALENDEILNAGDCIRIDLMSGYNNQAWEGSLGNIQESLTGVTINEITLAMSIAEQSTRESNLKYNEENGGIVSGGDYTIWLSNGQLEHRPYSFNDIIVYGPKKYDGGDLLFNIALTELDKEEYSKIRGDVEKFSSYLDGATSSQIATVEDVTESDNKGTLPVSNPSLDQPSNSSLSNLGKLKISGIINHPVVAYTIDAAKLFVNTYANINEQDDVIIQYDFVLSGPSESKNIFAPYARVGYYAVIRESRDKNESVTYAALDPTLPFVKTTTQDKEDDTTMNLILRVLKMPQNRCMALK